MIVVVCSVVAERDGKFLLVRERKAEAMGKYGLPGGQLEQGETLVQCAQREFTEETGLTPAHLVLTAITHKPATRAGNSVVRFVYRADSVEPTDVSAELHVSWLSKAEILTLSRSGRIRGADVLDLLEADGQDLTVSTY